MARLEIEIVGINRDFKGVLKDTTKDVNAFAKALNFDDSGIKKLNTSLTKTRQLLKDIQSLSSSIKSSFGSSFSDPGIKQELDNEKLAFAQAKTEAQNYRTEINRLAAEQAKLRAANAQSKSSTTAAIGSYKEAQQTLTALGKSIREAAGGFNSTSPIIKAQISQYKELNDKLKAFDAQLGNHQRNVGNYKSALSGLGSALSSYFSFTALIAYGAKVIKTNAEISDSLADVRRTAGLTGKEADSLAVSLKNIDTRTSLKDLLGIATIGGQLGISKNQLEGFTKAIDQLAVALGGELQGGAEGIAKSLGVLDNVFAITTSNSGNVEKSYNQIGSAILGLGQSGLATGDFLADFGERVGGVAKQAGIALPVVLSYGAVLQESGVSAEVAGTSFKKLISALGSNSGKFFQVAQFADANLTLKDFNYIVNTDTKKALDLFFAGLNKGGQSTIAFNTILKDLKLSQSGVSQSVAALSGHQQELNEHIAQATKDFNDASLATEQFKIKNDNLAGSIDKLNNAITNLTTNPNSGLGKFFAYATDSITDGIKALDTYIDRFYVLSKIAPSIINATLSGNDESIRKLQKINEGLLERRKASSQASYNDEIQAQGSIRGRAFVDAAKNETELNRTLTAQTAKLLSLAKDRNKALAVKKQFDGIVSNQEQQNINKTSADYARQTFVVGELLRATDALKKRSNQAAPEGFGKKTKSKKGSGSAIVPDFAGQISDLATKSQNEVDLFGLKGLDKTNEETKQKYAKLLADLDDIQKKYSQKYAKDSGKKAELDQKTADARKLIEDNLNATLNQNALDFAQKQSDIISGIQEKAGITREASRLKDLQSNDAYYNKQITKYQGFVEIIKALEEARLKERSSINEKYDNELKNKADELTSKIQEVQDRAFVENIKGTEQGRQRIQRELQKRLNDIKDYFDKLKALYAANPLALLGIGAAESAVTSNINKSATNAKNPVDTQLRESLRTTLDSFGKDFFNVLRNISSQADSSFKGIFSSLVGNLSSSINDVFLNQFTKKLTDSLNGIGGKLKLTLNDAIAGIGLIGGVISGATKKTSSIGQGLGGALSGAAAGFGVAGPIGAAIGGVVGAISGLFGASKAKKEEKIQQAALEEQKKQTALLERANALAYAASIIGRQTVNGIVSSVDINEFGQVITKVSGNDLLIIHDRTIKNRQRGT